MRTDSHLSPKSLLAAAQDGEAQSLGRLLELYRNYLHLLAVSQIDKRLQVRSSPSDVVQETFLEAHRDFGQFQGRSESEFLAWLRRILVNNLMRSYERHVRAQRRCVHREVSLHRLGEALEKSTARLEDVLADHAGSPSSEAGRHESAVALADQLAALPPDQREVIVLRHLRGLPFGEIAKHMDRSSGAVRMLWFRAMTQLRDRLSRGGLV
jgi:RNA polymerase sigma-70 factor, ECF subfamily